MQWTQDKLDLLREKYQEYGPRKFAKLFGISIGAVNVKASLLGITKKTRKIAQNDGRVTWTPEMIAIMKERYTTDGPVLLAKRFGRTLPAVLMKARSLGLKKRNWGRWTKDKLQALKDRYATEGGNKLAEEFGIPVDIVWAKASYLGLHTKAGIVELGQKTAENNQSCNIHYFDQWTPGAGYVFGFLLADGSIDKEERRLRANILTKDEAVLQFIQKELGGGTIYRRPGGVDSRGVKFRPQSRWTACSKILIEKLISLGMKPRKTYTDEVFPDVPEFILPHLVRGTLDGDGSVHVTKLGHCQLTFIGSPRFIQGLDIILTGTLGLHPRTVQRHQGKTTPYASITWTAHADLQKFYDFAYPPGFGFCLERKRKVLADWLENKRNRESYKGE